MVNTEKAAATLVAARRMRSQIKSLRAHSRLQTGRRIRDPGCCDPAARPLGGWKTMITGDLRCSPMPADVIFSTPATVPAGWPYKIEVEIGVRIGDDLNEPQKEDSIRNAIASVHPAIEVVLSRFSDAVSIEQGLADCQSNEAVIVGQALDGSTDLATLPLSLSIDGMIVAATSEGVSLDEMLPGLVWLANHALARGSPLRKGHRSSPDLASRRCGRAILQRRCRCRPSTAGDFPGARVGERLLSDRAQAIGTTRKPVPSRSTWPRPGKGW